MTAPPASSTPVSSMLGVVRRPLSATLAAAAASSDPLADATVVVTCLFRFDALERFLRSLRARYPEVRCVVCDNSFRATERRGPEWHRLTRLCAEFRAELVSAPFDCGAGMARNLAVAATTTPYVVVCEEDFELTDETDLEKLLRPLRFGQADCVGGLERYTDRGHAFHKEPNPAGHTGRIDTFQWTASLKIEGPWGRRTLAVSYPDVNDRGELAGVICRRADLIHNFYAIRRALYLAAPCDPRCKVDEHLDHFLRLQARGSRTYYTPEVTIDHHSRNWTGRLDDPVERKFAALRNRGGQFHPFVRENWGLNADRWPIRITKVPFVDRRRLGQTALPADDRPADDRPNVVVLTAGRTGSGLLVRMLIALGWRRNDVEDDYGEPPRLYTLNQQLLDGEAVAPAERDAWLDSLAEPWVIKDPRLGQTWDFWRPVLERSRRPVLVILSTRDAAAVAASYRKRGWNPAEAERRRAAAERAFAAWNGPKFRLRHEDVAAAALLVDPERLAA